MNNKKHHATDDYRVEWLSIDSVKPSPENDEIYGKVSDSDSQMESLIDSIRSRGLEEPIIVSADGFIVSGHRRYYACKSIGMETIPVRRKTFARNSALADWPKILTEYNPQRVKTAGTLLREALIRYSPEDSRQVLARNRDESEIRITADFLPVNRPKEIKRITKAKQPFLDATVKVVESLREFWPLTVRLVHYQLLNDPPLIAKYERSAKDAECQRYCNDSKSYRALIELLKQARYLGHIDMNAIDDPTRPQKPNEGFCDLQEFVSGEMRKFLVGYRRHLQTDQPRHIEVLGEKNTLLNIIGPVCWDYCVPMALGRGYCSTPVWRDIASRFHRSGKERMTLIVASDYDPEGLDLAEDAIASLRDLWDIPVDYYRVAVNREQVNELDLAEDFNPAKKTSTRYAKFVKNTGDNRTWELEALPPKYLQQAARDAIEANMDMDLFQAAKEQEEEEAEELIEIRDQLVSDLEI